VKDCRVQLVKVHYEAAFSLAADYEPWVDEKIGGGRSWGEHTGGEVGAYFVASPGEVLGVCAEVRAMGE
jgi:hypothetical protein